VHWRAGDRQLAEVQARAGASSKYVIDDRSGLQLLLETPKTEHGIGRVGAGRAAWFKDPDGNLIGVLEFDDPV
jgi:hypothetical protein